MNMKLTETLLKIKVMKYFEAMLYKKHFGFPWMDGWID